MNPEFDVSDSNNLISDQKDFPDFEGPADISGTKCQGCGGGGGGCSNSSGSCSGCTDAWLKDQNLNNN